MNICIKLFSASLVRLRCKFLNFGVWNLSLVRESIKWIFYFKLRIRSWLLIRNAKWHKLMSKYETVSSTFTAIWLNLFPLIPHHKNVNNVNASSQNFPIAVIIGSIFSTLIVCSNINFPSESVYSTKIMTSKKSPLKKRQKEKMFHLR